MNKLNTDCLLKIFLELDLYQKIRLELVCKRWLQILRSHHPYSNIKSLNVLDYMRRSSLGYFQQENLNFIPTVIALLTRCGPYLHELSFGSAWYRVSPPITEAINEYCKQLRRLDLSCSILCSDISVILKQISHQLTYFSIDESNLVDEINIEMGSYFGNMKKLREINLRKCRINMNYVLDLPEQLEVIDMSGIHHMNSEIITCFLVGHPNLKGLTLNPFPGAQFPYLNPDDPADGLDIVFDCISALTNLTHLNLGHISYDSTILPMNCLSRLTQLRSLELKECLGATGSSLREILTNAIELESLTIINCSKICDYSSIEVCRNLKHLNIEKSYHLCDDDMKNQTKLERLKLKQCLNVTNKIAQIVTTNCPVKELDLSLCPGIDDSLFEILSLTSFKLKKLLLDGCRITSDGVFRMCKDGKQILKTLIELDLSHNKYIDNQCIEHLIRMTSKLKRPRAPLKVYLFQTSAQREHFQATASRRVELIF